MLFRSQRKAFPYSLKQLSEEKILNWLVYYYRTTFLDEAGASLVLWRYAVSKNLVPESIPKEKQNECFLNSLTNNSQLSQLLTDFFVHLSSKVAFASRTKVSEAIQILKHHFNSKNLTLEEELEKRILSKLEINYSSRTVEMIETFTDGQAKDLEAEIEYPLLLKIQQVEIYLTKKYPTTEIHFFTNILRKQRSGQNTPFLVSPEEAWLMH